MYLKQYIQSWLFPENISATVIGVEIVCVVMICLFVVAMADSCPTWFTNTTGSCECGTELNGNVKCHQESLRVDMMIGRCMTLFNNISVVAGFCQHSFRRSMCRLSKIDDRCVDLRRSTIDVSTFEDRCVDLRRSMCRPSKIDD